MFVDLLVNTLILIFTYITIFAVYYTAVVFMSTKRKRFDYEQRYMSSKINNIVTIIYAQNDEKTVVPLLEQLNNQDYPTSNHQTHIILDNSTDDSANSLELLGGAKIWKLTEGVPLGKDEAISWLLERLISFQNVDAFVFLNANRSIKSDFLKNINASLYGSDVIVGATEILLDNSTTDSLVLDSINKFKNNIINTGRSLLGLVSQLDSDIVVIRQSVLEKIRCVDFQSTNSELKYTILLARNNFIVKFNPNIKTWIGVDKFEFKKPDLKYKFSLLKNCFPLMFSTNIRFTEFIFSLFTPNIITLILLYIVVAAFSYNYYFFYDIKFIIFIGVLLIASTIFAIKTVGFSKEDIKKLLIYPFWSINKKYFDKILKNIQNKKNNTVSNIEKVTVDVEVTDGKGLFPCKLDLISEDGLVKVVFRYKNKKYSTDSCIRMCDAIKQITDKLTERGLRIKICQTCAFFTPKIDGSTNMIKGFCGKISEEESDITKEAKECLLWSSCQYYLPQDISNVIDLSNFKIDND